MGHPTGCPILFAVDSPVINSRSQHMPFYSSSRDTEAARWRQLTANLFEAEGVSVPFSGNLPWQQAVRSILKQWGYDNTGQEGALIKKFAVALNAEYVLGVVFNGPAPASDYMRRVALAATGVCHCPSAGIGEALGDLIDWAASQSGGIPADSYAFPNGSDYYAFPDGSSYYAQP